MLELDSRGQASVDALLSCVSDQFAQELAKNRELTSSVSELRQQLEALKSPAESGHAHCQPFDGACTPHDDEQWDVPVEPKNAGVVPPADVHAVWQNHRKCLFRGSSDIASYAGSELLEEDLCRHMRLLFSEQAERIEACLQKNLAMNEGGIWQGRGQVSGEDAGPVLSGWHSERPGEQREVRRELTWKGSQLHHDRNRMVQALHASSQSWEDEEEDIPKKISSMKRSCRRSVKWFVSSNWFEFFFAMMILTNAVYLGIETDYMATTSRQDVPGIFTVAQYIYIVIFVFELVMRWIADGVVDFVWGSKNWAWNCFDIFTVAASLVEAGLTTVQLMGEVRVDDVRGISNVRLLRIIRVARLLRVFRISRILRFVGALRTLVYSIIGTLVSLFWALVLLILIMYSFGVVFTQAAGDHISDHKAEMELSNSTASYESMPLDHYWGRLSSSMFTLFMSIAAGISWELVVDPLNDIGWFFPALFSMFIAFTYFAVLNIVTANFCQSAIDSARYDRDMIVEGVIRQKKLYAHLLKRLFHQVDTNKSGSISFRELQSSFEDPEVQAYFASLDLESEDAWTLFKLLDENQGDDIDLHEFVNGCLRLRGTAKKLDLAMLIEDHKFLSRQLSSFMEHIDHQLHQVKILTRQIASTPQAPLAKRLLVAPRTPK